MPNPYSAEEYANMHLIYGECHCNSAAAARLYRERYPNAERHPDYRVFIYVHLAFVEGRLPGARHAGGRPRSVDDEEVLEQIEMDPGISLRAIEENTGISKTRAQRILKNNKYHPYHVQRVQSLLPRDYAPRLAFCRRMLAKVREDPFFLDKILWTDESSFKRDGYLNLHNLHAWCLENPHLMREDRNQYQFKVNMWTGILKGRVIGPFELPANLNGQNYLNFLQNDLPILLEEVPLNIYREMWFQQDGCPAHFALPVRSFLNMEYPDRWIGRLGSISWPPRSPDLNPLDFFYWGCIKEKVYSRPIRNLEQLRNKIAEAAAEINRMDFSRSLKRSFLRRCRSCIRARGRQFEHLI